MSSADRVEAARRWHGQVTSTPPRWDDVEIVTRLGVRDETVLRQVLLEDVETLVAHWGDLRAAVVGADGLTTSDSGPPDSPLPADDAPSSSRAGSAEAIGSRGQGELEGAARARFDALVTWLEVARDAGRDVGNIPEAELVKIALSDPRDAKEFKAFSGGVRNVASDMLDALRAVRVPPAETGASADQVEVERQTEPDADIPVHHSAPGALPTGDGPPGTVTTSAVSPRSGTTTPPEFRAVSAATPTSPPESISFRATGEESLELSWPAPPEDGGTRIFSVVASDEYDPSASPALGDLVVSTFDTQAVDQRPFTAPVRYVAIWLSQGATEAEARSAQPVLHATGPCVLPVRDCVVREDEGTVIGSWQAITGSARIDVLRVPREQAARLSEYSRSFRISPAVVSSGGFTDDGAVPGASYEYRIYAVATLADQDWPSPPVVRQVTLDATAEPVTDLEVTPSEGSDTTFDLSWTSPVLGEVEIYRSELAPASGIDSFTLDRSALQRQGLTPELRLDRMRERDGARVSMRNVPWPTGWSRAYFTPVTVVNEDLVKVGTTRNLLRTSPVTQLRLVERVDEQFLTFAWPVGAPVVKIYQGSPGGDHVDPVTETPLQELSEDDYRKYGGAHLEKLLPADGCSVHVVATSYTAGRAKYAKAATVQYEGLTRIYYEVVPVERERRRRGSVAPSVRKVVARSTASPSNLPFALVHHPDRMPLHAQDGATLGTTRASFVAGQPVILFDAVEKPGPTGFLRLFVVVPRDVAHRVAVLDPAITQLQVR